MWDEQKSATHSTKKGRLILYLVSSSTHSLLCFEAGFVDCEIPSIIIINENEYGIDKYYTVEKEAMKAQNQEEQAT